MKFENLHEIRKFKRIWKISMNLANLGNLNEFG